MATTSRHKKRPSSRKPTRRRRGASSSRARKLARVLACALAIIVVGLGIYQSATCSNDDSKLRACEQWRSAVQSSAEEVKLGAEWTDAILAAMYVESGGDPDVESVEGVRGDILQAAEGAYGDIVKNGSEEYGVAAQTPEASICAGCLEFKQNLKLWNTYLNGIQPDDSEKIQLVIQGYNFGAEGWYRWCKKRGITSYSVEAAQEYSETQMPADAKGTPTHAEKWLKAYEKIREASSES